jgi:hypothetical protein
MWEPGGQKLPLAWDQTSIPANSLLALLPMDRSDPSIVYSFKRFGNRIKKVFLIKKSLKSETFFKMSTNVFK